MATLGTQNISTSYPQLLKVSGNTPFTSTLTAIATGDESSVSALQISTLGVSSSGTLNSVGATTLASSLAVTGAATFSSSLGVTGAATLSSSLGVTGAATLSSSLGVTGVATFSTSINASSGTATIGTATISTATISTATIPTILGSVTFGSNITASTGTATIGTESVNVSTIASATFGTARITGSTGGVTAFNTGSTAFTGATLQDLDSVTTGSNTTTGTFTVSGAAIGDIVFGGLTSLSSSSGTAGVPTAGARMMSQFRVEGSNVIRYTILNTDTVSHGTIPAGTLYATAIRVV